METSNRKVTVRYYGMLSEKLGINEEVIEIPPHDIVLKAFVVELHPELRHYTFTTAVDLGLTELLRKEAQPQKIDIMPPFAGG